MNPWLAALIGFVVGGNVGLLTIGILRAASWDDECDCPRCTDAYLDGLFGGERA